MYIAMRTRRYINDRNKVVYKFNIIIKINVNKGSMTKVIITEQHIQSK